MTPEQILSAITNLTRLAGRIPGAMVVLGPPDNTWGAAGASCVDIVNRVWYGPKDEATGWPVGVGLTEGPRGPGVEMSVNGTHILYRWVGEAGWRNLIALAAIKGADGREIELRRTATHLQWRLGSGPWTDLAPIAELKGEAGATPVITPTLTMIAHGQPATVVKTGTAEAPALDFRFPAPLNGKDADIVGVTVTMGAPGSDADVALGGLPGAREIALTLPRGDKGDVGLTPALTVGTVTTGVPGSSASAGFGGAAEAPVLSLTIPRGDKGDLGPPPNLSAQVNYIAHGQPATATRSGPDAAPVFTFNLPRPLDGAPGPQIEMRAADGYFQTRYVGEPDWANIISLSTFIGPKGDGLKIDARGPDLGSRSAYDGEAEGFAYLDIGAGRIYWRETATEGVWSDPLEFGSTLGAILEALGQMDATQGVIVQTGAATFAKHQIGAGSAASLLDRAAGDARYRQVGSSLSLSDVAGLIAALGDKADAAAVLAALASKLDITDPAAARAALGISDSVTVEIDEVNGLRGAMDLKADAAAVYTKAASDARYRPAGAIVIGDVTDLPAALSGLDDDLTVAEARIGALEARPSPTFDPVQALAAFTTAYEAA